MFSGKPLLITGGTGSVGNQYVKNALADYKLERLINYSSRLSENREPITKKPFWSDFPVMLMKYILYFTPAGSLAWSKSTPGGVTVK